MQCEALVSQLLLGRCGTLAACDDAERAVRESQAAASVAAQLAEAAREEAEARLLAMSRLCDTLRAHLETSQRSQTELQAALRQAQQQLTSSGAMAASEREQLERRCSAADARAMELEREVLRLSEQARSRVGADDVARMVEEERSRAHKLRTLCRSLERQVQDVSGRLQRETSVRQVAEQAAERAKCAMEEQVAEARLQQAQAEQREAAATKRATALESRVRTMEEETRALRLAVAQAREGMGLMKTIAKIRSTELTERPVGFDAMVSRVDAVTRSVNDRIALRGKMGDSGK